MEIGRFELGKKSGQNSEGGIMWVPQTVRQSTVVESPAYWDPLAQLDDVWKSQKLGDPNGRLLDDLSSKEDHVAKLEAQQKAAREN